MNDLRGEQQTHACAALQRRARALFEDEQWYLAQAVEEAADGDPWMAHLYMCAAKERQNHATRIYAISRGDYDYAAKVRSGR